jgi:hypothetical protein
MHDEKLVAVARVFALALGWHELRASTNLHHRFGLGDVEWQRRPHHHHGVRLAWAAAYVVPAVVARLPAALSHPSEHLWRQHQIHTVPK